MKDSHLGKRVRSGAPETEKFDMNREPIKQQTVDEIVERILAFEPGTRFMVLAPVVSAKKGMHEKVFEDARKSGFVRVGNQSF